ncbi:hypothetical protein ATKI12_3962 [Kitasatospora sp. Ki12]
MIGTGTGESNNRLINRSPVAAAFSVPITVLAPPSTGRVA